MNDLSEFHQWVEATSRSEQQRKLGIAIGALEGVLQWNVDKLLKEKIERVLQ